MLEFLFKAVNYLFGKTLQRNHIFIGSSLRYIKRARSLDRNYFDYIRLSTLELIAEEIRRKKILGNVAELGVYQGKFARYINLYFPERTLYLFDTFDGFDQRDIAKEKDRAFSSGEQDFSNTSVEKVLAKMPFREKCRPVIGFFPQSATAVNDQFAFVSLDADLYDPISEGLKFFYPRLSAGGYIFIHDFNNEDYRGARKAVEDFCAERHISYTPLPDLAGTAILAK